LSAPRRSIISVAFTRGIKVVQLRDLNKLLTGVLNKDTWTDHGRKKAYFLEMSVLPTKRTGSRSGTECSFDGCTKCVGSPVETWSWLCHQHYRVMIKDSRHFEQHVAEEMAQILHMSYNTNAFIAAQELEDGHRIERSAPAFYLRPDFMSPTLFLKKYLTVIELDGPGHRWKQGNNDTAKYKEFFEWINRLGDGSLKGFLVRIYHPYIPKPDDGWNDFLKTFWNDRLDDMLNETNGKHIIHLVGYPGSLLESRRVKELLSIRCDDLEIKVWNCKKNKRTGKYEAELVDTEQFYQSVIGKCHQSYTSNNSLNNHSPCTTLRF
jgi:hypothetical protein